MTVWNVTASGVRLTDELSQPRTPCGVRPRRRDRDTGGAADSRERLDPRVHACHDNDAQSGYGLMNQPCQRFTGRPQPSPAPRLAAAPGPAQPASQRPPQVAAQGPRRGSTSAAARQYNDGARRSMRHERAFPQRTAMHKYAALSAAYRWSPVCAAAAAAAAAADEAKASCPHTSPRLPGSATARPCPYGEILPWMTSCRGSERGRA